MKTLTTQEEQVFDKVSGLIVEIMQRIEKGETFENVHKQLLRQYGEELTNNVLIIFNGITA